MLEFIKMFGLGILYTILFPVIVAVFACYLIYVFFNYIVIEFLTIFGFFFGYTFSEETELEKRLNEIKNNKEKVETVKEPSYDYAFPSDNLEDDNGEGSDGQ